MLLVHYLLMHMGVKREENTQMLCDTDTLFGRMSGTCKLRGVVNAWH